MPDGLGVGALTRLPVRRQPRAGHSRVTSSLVVLATTTVLLAGCSGGGSSGTVATTPTGPATASVPTAGPDLLVDPAQVPLLVRARLGEAPSLRRIIVFRDGVSLEVRDPVKRDNLDTYRYTRGEWAAPTPVSVTLREIEELDDVTFGLGAVRWTAIPGLIQRAYDGLDLEGEEITSVSVDRIKGRPPRLYIGVSGLRGSGRLIANADGTDVEIRRN